MITALALLALWPGRPASAADTESELECAYAEALLSTGDAGGAVEHLDNALELDPENERAQLILVRARVSLGDLEGALEQIDALLAAHPDDPGLLREQGYVMILQDDLLWAMQALKQAVKTDPDDGLAQLYLGHVLLLLDSPDDAVEPLGAAAGDADEPSSTALYLEAVALSRAGNNVDAWEAVESAIEMGLVSDPWSEAAHSLRSTLKQELVPFRIFDMSLSTGLFWDSNVPLFTEDLAEVMLADGTEQSSFGLALAGSLMLRPLRGRHWSLGAGGSIYQRFNFEKDVDDFNTTLYGGVVELVRSWDAPSPLRRVILRYLHSLVCLWGGPLVDFDRYYRFSESYGGDASAEFTEGSWGATRVRLMWRYALFTDYGRDNMGFSASVNQTFFMLDRRLKLALEAGIRVEHAQNLAWDVITPRVFVGLSVLLPWELQLLAAFTYEHEDHFHSGPETRWAMRRVDDVLVYSAGLSRTFLGQLTVGAGFSYTDNRSTLLLNYDYDRAVVSLNIGWRLK
ncbi:MAG: tetratricopeptide repeat protein [Deltaproteobacteria bacterium]|nr:tetratricopeptide repeat protein [Deltaproteobacteria bacterium]